MSQLLPITISLKPHFLCSAKLALFLEIISAVNDQYFSFSDAAKRAFSKAVPTHCLCPILSPCTLTSATPTQPPMLEDRLKLAPSQKVFLLSEQQNDTSTNGWNPSLPSQAAQFQTQKFQFLCFQHKSSGLATSLQVAMVQLDSLYLLTVFHSNNFCVSISLESNILNSIKTIKSLHQDGNPFKVWLLDAHIRTLSSYHLLSCLHTSLLYEPSSSIYLSEEFPTCMRKAHTTGFFYIQC